MYVCVCFWEGRAEFGGSCLATLTGLQVRSVIASGERERERERVGRRERADFGSCKNKCKYKIYKQIKSPTGSFRSPSCDFVSLHFDNESTYFHMLLHASRSPSDETKETVCLRGRIIKIYLC